MKRTHMAITMMSIILGITASVLVMHEYEHTISTQYVPSNIAHSLGSVSEVTQGAASWTTNDIQKVKDQVDYTVKGTVVHISEPIPWTDPTPVSEGYKETRGKDVKIEIDIEVDETGKSKKQLDAGSIVTVTITGKLLGDKLRLDGGEEHYELGERVIVHIAEDPNDIIGKNVLYVKLGENGKYKIQDNRAYNDLYPEGRSVSSVMSELR